MKLNWLGEGSVGVPVGGGERPIRLEAGACEEKGLASLAKGILDLF